MRLLLVAALSLAGCGGMNFELGPVEFGGLRLQTGAQPDTTSRSVFEPEEKIYQIITPAQVEHSYERSTVTKNYTPRDGKAPPPPPPALP